MKPREKFNKNEKELLKSIISTRQELNNANHNFEYAQEELIDFYAYQIKAIKAKLDYLVRIVKEKGLKVDLVEATEIENVG
jgi:uncharacterized protein (DUF885 family)